MTCPDVPPRHSEVWKPGNAGAKVRAGDGAEAGAGLGQELVLEIPQVKLVSGDSDGTVKPAKSSTSSAKIQSSDRNSVKKKGENFNNWCKIGSGWAGQGGSQERWNAQDRWGRNRSELNRAGVSRRGQHPAKGVKSFTTISWMDGA